MKSSEESLRTQAARIKPRVEAAAATLGNRANESPAHEGGRQMLLDFHDLSPRFGGWCYWRGALPGLRSTALHFTLGFMLPPDFAG